MEGCNDCPDVGPQVDESSMGCEGMTPSDCVIMSENSSCFKYAKGDNLTKAILKICDAFRSILKKVSNIEDFNKDSYIIQTEDNIGLYLEDGSSYEERDYTTDYTTSNIKYRVQPIGNLLRVEYNFDIEFTENLTTDSTNKDIILTHNISDIDNSLTTIGKKISSALVNPFKEPFSIDKNPSGEDLTPKNSRYENTNSLLGVNSDSIVNKLFVKLADIGPYTIGGVLFLPIEKI